MSPLLRTLLPRLSCCSVVDVEASKANSDVGGAGGRGGASPGAGVRPAPALVAHTGPDLC